MKVGIPLNKPKPSKNIVRHLIFLTCAKMIQSGFISDHDKENFSFHWKVEQTTKSCQKISSKPRELQIKVTLSFSSSDKYHCYYCKIVCLFLYSDMSKSTPKEMPLIYFHGSYNIQMSSIAELDRTSFQLKNLIFPPSYRRWQ